jgi:hypothetical protein
MVRHPSTSSEVWAGESVVLQGRVFFEDCKWRAEEYRFDVERDC